MGVLACLEPPPHQLEMCRCVDLYGDWKTHLQVFWAVEICVKVRSVIGRVPVAMAQTKKQVDDIGSYVVEYKYACT